MLFKKCEAELQKSLTAENAVRTFLEAYLHSADNLKLAAIQFISRNFAKHFRKSSDLKSLAKEYPEAMLELFEGSCLDNN